MGKGLTQITRLLTPQRGLARLQGTAGQVEASLAENRGKVAELTKSPPSNLVRLPVSREPCPLLVPEQRQLASPFQSLGGESDGLGTSRMASTRSGARNASCSERETSPTLAPARRAMALRVNPWAGGGGLRRVGRDIWDGLLKRDDVPRPAWRDGYPPGLVQEEGLGEHPATDGEIAAVGWAGLSVARNPQPHFAQGYRTIGHAERFPSER